MPNRYTTRQQNQYRTWLEDDGRPRDLPKEKVWECIDTDDGNRHKDVFLDETGTLYVGDTAVLKNTSYLPDKRHNLSWGMSHTPFRSLYGAPLPYSRLASHRWPLILFDVNEIFGHNVNNRDFQIARWYDWTLQQRQDIYDYVDRNKRRLKWLVDYDMGKKVLISYPTLKRSGR